MSVEAYREAARKADEWPHRARSLNRLMGRIAGLFAPRKPVPIDRVLTARLLNGLVLSSFPVLLSIVAVRFALGTRMTETANLTLIALAAVDFLAALLLRSGRVYLSAGVLTFSLWAAGTFLSWTYFGIRDAMAIFPLFAVLFAFLVFPLHAGILLSVLSIGSIWLLVAQEMRGLRRPVVTDPGGAGFTLSTIVILVSLLALIFGEILRRAVRRTIAAQQALSRSKQELSSILQRTPDIIYRIDTEGRITYVNEAVRRYGYDPLEMVGTRLIDYVHPEDRDVVASRLGERRAGDRGLRTLEIRLLAPARQEGVSESTVISVPQQPVFLIEAEGLCEDRPGAQHFVGVQGIAKDVTDRRRAEEALRKSEEKYSKVFQAAPAGIAVASLDEARFLEVNEEFERIFGYRRDELIGRSALDFGIWVNPAERKRVLDLLRRDQPAKDLELQYRTKNGDLRIVRYNGQMIVVGGIACLVSAVGDVTDRKRAEEALKKSEDKYAKVFQAAPAGIAVASLDGARLLDVNEEFERTFGYRRNELVGRSAFDIGLWANPGDRDHVISLLRRNEPAKDLEGQGRTKSGELRTVRYNAQQMDIGGAACLVTAFEDITDRRRLQSQLQQAQKLEAVGRLAGGIAHDFNNMLAVVLGQAEVASRDIDRTSPMWESVQEIRKAAERSAELTRQLLVFARRKNTAPCVLNMNTAISERLGMLQRLIGENIALKWNPSASLWCVKMDPAQVDQILLNLSVNARDAIADVGTLTISTENKLREGMLPPFPGGQSPVEWVMLTVTDTGAGMTKETLAHLFEPFFTTKEIGKGTGMGLATVYGIVKDNGGWIEVESELGKGTTFRLYFPRAYETAARAHEASQTQLARGHETVLVVEDESAILKIILKSLQRLGYTVLEAGSAEDALALASQHEGPLHLLLTDVIMPRMNGRDLYARIVTLHPAIRVLFMSGYSADIFPQADSGKEDVPFLQKPFTMQQLSARVREALDQDHVRGADVHSRGN